MYNFDSLDPVTYLNRKEAAVLYNNAGKEFNDEFMILEQVFEILNDIDSCGHYKSEDFYKLSELIKDNSKNILEFSQKYQPNHLKALYDNTLYSINELINNIDSKDFYITDWIFKSHIIPLFTAFFDTARYLLLVEPYENELNARNNRQLMLCEKLLASEKTPVDEQKDTDIELSILVVAYNHIDLTTKCIESIKKYTTGISYELVVIDNGSSDETLSYFKSIENAKVVHLENNVGLLFAIHIAVTSGILKGKFWAYLNNDAFVTNNWAENLLSCIKSDPKTALVMPVTDNHAPSFTIDIPFMTIPEIKFKYKSLEEKEILKIRENNLQKMYEFALENNKADKSKWRDITITYPFASIMRPSARLHFGFMDDPFYFYKSFYYSDTDGSVRLAYSGYRQILCGDCFVHHEDGGTIGGYNKQRNKKLQEGETALFKKYGFFSIETEGFDKTFLSLVERPKKDSVKVLFYEPMFGTEMVMFKNILKEYGIKTVTIDTVYTEKAYSRIMDILSDKAVYAVNISDIDEKITNNKYDIICFGKLANEIYGLSELVMLSFGLLSDDGCLLTKICNKSGLRIVEDLLYNGDNPLTELRVSSNHLIDYNKYLLLLENNGFSLKDGVEIRYPSDIVENRLYKELIKVFSGLPEEYQKNRDYLNISYWCIKAVKKK